MVLLVSIYIYLYRDIYLSLDNDKANHTTNKINFLQPYQNSVLKSSPQLIIIIPSTDHWVSETKEHRCFIGTLKSNDTEIQTVYVFALRKCNADIDLAQKNIWEEIDAPEHSPVSKASL